jgi:hypothetical protein
VFLNQHAKVDIAKQAQASNLTPQQLAAPPYCGAAVTPTMSSATRTYVTALNALDAAHAGYTVSVRSHGGVPTLSDINGIISSDNAFVRTLSTIKWSNPLQGAEARQVSAAIHDYDSALTAQVLSQGSTPSDDSDLRSATEQRNVTTTGMRQMLGLPRSTCSFPLPV